MTGSTWLTVPMGRDPSDEESGGMNETTDLSLIHI